MDIGVSVVFWVLAGYVVDDRYEKQNIFTRPNSKLVICLANYSIVYIAKDFK
jgi:hypothetical protein